MLKLIPVTFAAALAVTPAIAADDDLSDGIDLLSEGTQLLLRGLMGEIEPAFRDLESVEKMLRDLMAEMSPDLQDLQDALRDLSIYHPPEILPNGDIIIRRRIPKSTLPEPGENGEIEL